MVIPGLFCTGGNFHKGIKSILPDRFPEAHPSLTRSLKYLCLLLEKGSRGPPWYHRTPLDSFGFRTVKFPHPTKKEQSILNYLCPDLHKASRAKVDSLNDKTSIPNKKIFADAFKILNLPFFCHRKFREKFTIS
jgi:hypothetical protein